MPDKEKVIDRLKKVSRYFKSMMMVGYDGDLDIYREHRESVKMAIALLKGQEAVVHCKDCKYYRYYGLSEEIVSQCIIDYRENQDGDWFCADGKRREEK